MSMRTDSIPHLTINKRWYPDDVRQMCICYQFYSCGNSDEYGEMLDYVRDHPNPTLEDIAAVALDIYEHSSGILKAMWSVEDIATNLLRDVVSLSCSKEEET